MFFKALSDEKKTYIVSVFGLHLDADIYNTECKFCIKAENNDKVVCPEIALREAIFFWAAHSQMRQVELFAPEEVKGSSEWVTLALQSSCPYNYRSLVKFRRKYIISKYYKQIADALRIFTPDERKLLIDVFDHDDEYMRMVMHVLRTL